MKYKWPVTAIKPLKNKRFSVTNNPSALVYFMSSMIRFHSWLNLLTAARLNQTSSRLGSNLTPSVPSQCLASA